MRQHPGVERAPTKAAYSPAQQTFLDCVRVIATNLVVLEHSRALFGLHTSGYQASLGVVLFFALSGFLIFSSAWRRPPGGPGLLGFLSDRSARIFLPFVPALLLAVALNELLGLERHGQAGVNEGALAFAGNLLLLNDYPVFQAVSRFVDIEHFYIRSYNGAEPFWTIPIEYWTYVCFGVFFFVFHRGEKISRALLVLLLGISLPVFLWNACAGGGETLSLVWATGALLAYLWQHSLGQMARARLLGAALVAFGLIALAGRSAKVGFHPYEFQTALLLSLVFFGGFAIGRSVEGGRGPLAALIRFAANYSYSLYLVHNIVLIVFAESLAEPLGAYARGLALVTAHALAFAFYLAFERHHAAVSRWLKARIRSPEPMPRALETRVMETTG